MTKNYRRRVILLAVSAVLLIAAVITFASVASFAASKTDAVRLYEITADINEDASVNLVYHIEWEVLESDGIGPLEWVEIGIPNSHYITYGKLSGNIYDIEYENSSSQTFLKITFNKKYYKGETVSFDFFVGQDYMYQVDAVASGQTRYYFTPGWFDEIDVDRLVISWNADKTTGNSGNCLNKDGYLTWETSLPAGDTYSVTVDYGNDAFDFDESKYSASGEDYNGGYYSSGGGLTAGLFSVIPVLIWVVIAVIIVKSAVSRKQYKDGSGLGEETKKKVTRTKVEYYPECQGCGAQRKDGETTCSYCGRSFVKSEEVLSEEEIENEDKDALRYDSNGEYRYTSRPNTFVRVNVVHVPVGPRPGVSRGGAGRGSSHRGGGCAHSACACACASCACACACACAGGGRAGCTAKDFYNTNLKLKQLELKKAGFKKKENKR